MQSDVPDALVGDAIRLRQVLLNLVSNAIKFTDAGEVDVRVEVSVGVVGDLALDEVGLRFTVRDTGIGIPREQQERIFRAFEQEDTSTTRKYGGTGLGLTISARLVALMGGTITVQSEPGRGSTFAFTARFRQQPQPEEPVLAVRLRPTVRVPDFTTCPCWWSMTTPPTGIFSWSGYTNGRCSPRRSATQRPPWMPSTKRSLAASRIRWYCSTPACPKWTA